MNFRKEISKHFTNKHLANFYADDLGGTPIIVFIWDNVKSYAKATKSPNTLAMFQGTDTGGASIHLQLDNIGGGIFAHELYHASRKYLAEKDEEQAALDVEYFTAGFWRWFYENFDLADKE